LPFHITVAATSVEAATVRAIDLEVLARVTVALARVGAAGAPGVDARDAAELPDLGAGFNERRVWRHLVADERGRGEAAGLTASPTAGTISACCSPS
jgi:hypothetical protein